MAEMLRDTDVERAARLQAGPWVPFGSCVPAGIHKAPRHTESGGADASLIRAFIDHGRACGAIDPAVPMSIVDLAPGAGERAWRVLGALDDAVQPVRYLAVCDGAEAANALRAHPFLQPHFEAQRLEIVVCQGDRGWDSIASHGNPFVIIAHDAFSGLRHDLFACHYGELMEAWVSQSAQEEVPAIDWRSHSPDDVISPVGKAVMAQLTQYAGLINSAAVLVPSGAMHCLHALIELSAGRYFLLASDVGVSSAAQVRLGALMPCADMLARRCVLPVNFDMLSRWQRAQGAQVWTADEGEGVYQLALRDRAHPLLEERLSSLQRVRSPREAAQTQLVALAAAFGDSLSAEHAFVLLRASDDAPQALLALAPVLIAAAPMLQQAAVLLWRDALEHACAQHYPAVEDAGFLRAAAAMAMGLDAWGLATRLLEQSAQLYGATWQDMVMLAHSYESCGCSPKAHACLALACHEFPEEDAVRIEYERVTAQRDQWRELDWYFPHLAAEGPLRLEPLGATHALALLYQYRDPQIGMMTRLPAFEDIAELEVWMTERRAQPTRADFAVMHEEYGFAGVVSANSHEGSAFFHFWMGVDFQGAGLGTQAARLLIAQLRGSQTSYLLTAAYPDNARSLRALAALGMQVLDISALPPEEGMIFYGMRLNAKSVEVEAEDETSGALLCSVLRRHSRHSDGAFQFGV